MVLRHPRESAYPVRSWSGHGFCHEAFVSVELFELPRFDADGNGPRGVLFADGCATNPATQPTPNVASISSDVLRFEFQGIGSSGIQG
jgi:hypothetical protein